MGDTDSLKKSGETTGIKVGTVAPESIVVPGKPGIRTMNPEGQTVTSTDMMTDQDKKFEEDEKKAMEEESKDNLAKLDGIFTSRTSWFKEHVLDRGSNKNREAMIKTLRDDFTRVINNKFDEQRAELIKKYIGNKDKTAARKEYDAELVLLKDRIKMAAVTVEAYLGSVTDANEKGTVDFDDEALSKMVKQKNALIAAITRPELKDSETKRTLEWAIGMSTGAADPEGFNYLGSKIGDETKKGEVTMILTLLSSDKKVAFVENYLDTKVQGGPAEQRKGLLSLVETVGISPLEITRVMEKRGFPELTDEETKTCEEKWKNFDGIRELANNIGHDSNGAYNIGEQFNLTNLFSILLKGAGVLNIALNAILHNQDLLKGNFGEFTKSITSGVAMVAAGSYANKDGYIRDKVEGKTDLELQREARQKMIRIYNGSTKGWYKFFGGEKSETAVDAFAGYVDENKKNSADKLRKESLDIAGFKKYLENGGKPAEAKAEAKKDEKKEEPETTVATVDYNAKKKEYEPVLKDFESKTKEGTTTKMNDESLQELAEIFDVLKIQDSTMYKSEWEIANKAV